MTPEEIGRLVRQRRKTSALRQQELAALAGVGSRFVCELEKGKATLELGRVLRVMETLGLELEIHERDWQRTGPNAGT
ncbi:MAG: hypothetical protein RL434_245 [Pseudomonadota bacterium]|jgi:y4mF family transcriptional regulator